MNQLKIREFFRQLGKITEWFHVNSRCMALLSMLSLVLCSSVQAETQCINASTDGVRAYPTTDINNPIALCVKDSGAYQVWLHESGVSVPQYAGFDEISGKINSYLWLNGDNSTFRNVLINSNGSSVKKNTTDVSNGLTGKGTKEEPFVITTVINTKHDVGITQKFSYVKGDRGFKKKWIFENNSNLNFSDVRFIHGGQTFFNGLNSGYSWYDPYDGRLSISNSGYDYSGVMSLYTPYVERVFNRYYGGDYSLSDFGAAILGSINSKVNDSELTDMGYMLQWNIESFFPGNSFSIVFHENFSLPGALQVFSKDEGILFSDVNFRKKYSVKNLNQNESISINLLANLNFHNSNWSAVLEGPSVLTLAPNQLQYITIAIKASRGVSIGSFNYASLTATDVVNISNTRTASTKLTVLGESYAIHPQFLDFEKKLINTKNIKNVIIDVNGTNNNFGDVRVFLKSDGLEQSAFSLPVRTCLPMTENTCSIEVVFLPEQEGIFNDKLLFLSGYSDELPREVNLSGIAKNLDVPLCIPSRSVIGPNQILTVQCAGVVSGATVKIPGLTCIASADQTAICTGKGEDLSQPPQVITDYGEGLIHQGDLQVQLDNIAPALPMCTHEPSIVGSFQNLRVDCQGVEIGSKVEIQNMTCTTNESVAICNGYGVDLQSPLMVTITDGADNSARGNIHVTIDNQAPARPNCSALPSSPMFRESVTITCSGLEEGSSITFISTDVICAPQFATSDGVVTCTVAWAEYLGPNPPLSVIDKVGNRTTIIVPLMMEYHPTILTPCVASPNPAKSTDMVTVVCENEYNFAPRVSIPGTDCSFRNLYNDSTICKGLASNLGNNPVYQINDAGSSNVGGVLPLQVGTPGVVVLPTCKATPDLVGPNKSVVIVCTGVTEDSSIEINGATCSPQDAEGEVICEGNSSVLGTQPILTVSKDDVQLQATVLLHLDPTPPAEPFCKPNPAVLKSSQSLVVECRIDDYSESLEIPGLTCYSENSGYVNCSGFGRDLMQPPQVIVTDQVGNQYVGPLEVTVDDTPPALPTCIAKPSVLQMSQNLRVDCSDVEDGAVVDIRGLYCVTKSTTASCFGLGSELALPPQITVMDSVGNQNSGLLEVKVIPDQLTPIPPTINPLNINSQKVTGSCLAGYIVTVNVCTTSVICDLNFTYSCDIGTPPLTAGQVVSATQTRLITDAADSAQNP